MPACFSRSRSGKTKGSLANYRCYRQTDAVLCGFHRRENKTKTKKALMIKHQGTLLYTFHRTKLVLHPKSKREEETEEGTLTTRKEDFFRVSLHGGTAETDMERKAALTHEGRKQRRDGNLDRKLRTLPRFSHETE